MAGDVVELCREAYQGIDLRSRRNSPVNFAGASVTSQTGVSAPCSTVRGAPSPPISVRTQPGQTELTAIFFLPSAEASWVVTALSAVFEMLYAGWLSYERVTGPYLE